MVKMLKFNALAWFACLAAIPVLFAQTTNLNYRIIDAEFSSSLNRLVSVSAHPNRVNLYDPATRKTVSSLPLPQVPTCISISPDGKAAVVGHNGYVSVVNLTRQAVTRTFQAKVDVFDIVHGGNGFAYLFPRSGYSGSVYSLRLSDGAELTGNIDGNIRAGTVGRLHPGGKYIYGADNDVSPSDIEKYDISAGPLKKLYESAYHGDYAMCGNIWPSEDGLRLVTACGNIFRASETRSEDMIYQSRLSGVSGVISAAHALQAKRLLVLGGSSPIRSSSQVQPELAIFEYDLLTPLVRIKLPPMQVNGRMIRTFGKLVFASDHGTKALVVQQADAEVGLPQDYSIAMIDLKNQVVNSASLEMTPVSPGQIVSLFGSKFASGTAVPATNPPPDTQLGLTAKFRDSREIERIAPMYYLGPDQINLVIPPDTNPGPGRLILDSATERLVDLEVQVNRVQPGIYTANANGQGPPAAVVTYVANDTQSSSLAFQPNPSGGAFINRPIDLRRPETQVYISLYGTGFRRATKATARIGNVTVPVSGFAPQPEVVGLDQINIGPIPASLYGQKDAPVVVTFDGIEANAVTVSFL